MLTLSEIEAMAREAGAHDETSGQGAAYSDLTLFSAGRIARFANLIEAKVAAKARSEAMEEAAEICDAQSTLRRDAVDCARAIRAAQKGAS